ncbi:DUF6241 domain-containing protein [Bacillus testis]|uniref:DUF6241 domain-containing protein n=1 Tax=Bacillus testis TaxID=1622072 RepID=UPI00067E739E|nr:DUF6241 domain-containing protein [Bacillus testis]
MKKKKRYTLIWIILIVACLGVGAYYIVPLIVQDESTASNGAEDFKSMSKQELDRLQKSNQRSQEYLEKLNGQSSEETIIEAMHKMTHQKVRAKEKWGALEMNAANIQQIKNVLLADSNHFEERDKLLHLIEKWEKGDFTGIDEDHNKLWKLQKGNIGKATGILSPQEEKEFIEANFSGKTSDPAEH